MTLEARQATVANRGQTDGSGAVGTVEAMRALRSFTVRPRLPEELAPLERFEPVEAEMTMTLDGEVVATGAGAACLGDPLRALAWLAETARELGDPLRAGQVVLSGALGPMRPVGTGAEVVADITGLGTVRAHFV